MTNQKTKVDSTTAVPWLAMLGAVGTVGMVGVGTGAGCGAATAIRPQTAPAAAAAMVVPNFALPSTRGGELRFAEVTQKSAVALVFYRGFW